MSRRLAWQIIAFVLGVFLIGGSVLEFGWSLADGDVLGMVAGVAGVALGVYVAVGAQRRTQRQPGRGPGRGPDGSVQ